MAFALSDRVKETTTTTGTGSITLGGAATGYQTFNSGVGVGNTAYYCIAGQGTSEWEVGFGTLSASTTLARTKIFASSNAGSAVNFSAGTKDVFVTFPASAGYSGASGQVFTASGTFTIPTGITRVKVTIIGGGGGGGGGNAGGECNPSYSGGGGGGAGAAVKWLTSLTPGNTLTVTRGAGGGGGAGGDPAFSGTSGGTSSVASGTETITTVSATGGAGGGHDTGNSGGAGGTGSSGDLNVAGGGGNANGGVGGSSMMGGAGIALGGAGGVYGGGGGGGNSNGSSVGGAGANGVIFFEW